MTAAEPAILLTDLFRDFYGKMAQLRRRIEQAAATGGIPLEAVQEPLLSVLNEMDADRGTRVAVDPLRLEQAQYALAAFADDHFKRLDWPENESWKASTLESQLFHTDEAGLEIFRRIEKLLELGDPGLQDLGRVYLMALALGFRGDLPKGTTERMLHRYRRRLLAFAEPDSQSADDPRWISPSAYRHTSGGATKELLPNLGLWGWLACGSVVLLLLVSYLSWTAVTAPVADAIEQILGPGATR